MFYYLDKIHSKMLIKVINISLNIYDVILDFRLFGYLNFVVKFIQYIIKFIES